MRLFFLLLISFSFSYAINKQIILGSYTIKENGTQALAKLNKTISQDPKLQEQMKVNTLESKMKLIGKYYVVSLAPLTTRRQLFRTLDRLKPYYNDAFVLELPQPVITPKPQEKPLPVSAQVVAEKKDLPILKEKPVTPPKPAAPQPKKLKEEQKVQPKEGSGYSLYLIILLAIVAIMGTSYAVFRRKNS